MRIQSLCLRSTKTYTTTSTYRLETKAFKIPTQLKQVQTYYFQVLDIALCPPKAFLFYNPEVIALSFLLFHLPLLFLIHHNIVDVSHQALRVFQPCHIFP